MEKFNHLVNKDIISPYLCEKPRCNYVRWCMYSRKYINTLEYGHICERIHHNEKYHDF